MISKRVRDVVFGSEEHPEAVRLHAAIQQPSGFGDWLLGAVEIIRRPSDVEGSAGSAVPIVVILHFSGTPADVPEAVYALVRSANKGPSVPKQGMPEVWALMENMGLRFRTAPHSIRALTHIIRPDRNGPTLQDQKDEDYRLLWSLAAATPRPVALPARDDRSRQLTLSADWQGLVLRDGAAFVSVRNEASGYEEFARVYCRSIYIDALVLASFQLEAATQLADRTQALISDSPSIESLAGERKAMLRFRGRLWWAHVSDRASIVDQIVRDFQVQHHLPALVDQVVQDLGDITDYLASEEMLLKAGREESRQRAEARMTSVLGLFATVLVVPSLVIGFTQLAVAPSWTTVAVAVATSASLTLIALLVIRTVARRQWLG